MSRCRHAWSYESICGMRLWRESRTGARVYSRVCTRCGKHGQLRERAQGVKS